MLFDEDMGVWVSKMSGICAAGTGAFLDSVAAKLNVPVEQLAGRVNYDSSLQLSSVCAVLSATSVNKFKNRYPLGDVIAAACRAQARTIISGVGSLFLDYRGPIVFQGRRGLESRRGPLPRRHHRQPIVIPEHHAVMGALGAATIALDGWQSRGVRVLAGRGRRLPAGLRGLLRVVAPPPVGSLRKSVAMRTQLTRREFLSRSDAPLVWRNLFYPRRDPQCDGRPHVDAGDLRRAAGPQRKSPANDVRPGRPQGLRRRNLLLPPRPGGGRSLAEARLHRRHQRTLPAGRAGVGRSGVGRGLPRSLSSPAYPDPPRRPFRGEHRRGPGGVGGPHGAVAGHPARPGTAPEACVLSNEARDWRSNATTCG